MPSVSPKQARFMAAASHNAGFAKRAGISMKVAKDFNQADKGGPMLKKKKRMAKMMFDHKHSRAEMK